MIEVDVMYISTHEIRICKSGVRVLGRVGRECTCLANRFPYRLGRYIRSTCTAFPGVPVHRYADTAIVGVLEVLDIAETRGCRQARIMTCSNFSLIDTLLPGEGQRLLYQRLEFLASQRLPSYGLIHRAQRPPLRDPFERVLNCYDSWS